MKKFVTLGFILVLICSLICSCNTTSNMTMFDTNHFFEEAVIFRADGEQRVKIRNWCEHGYGGIIQITLENGEVYLTHSSNVILISTDN